MEMCALRQIPYLCILYHLARIVQYRPMEVLMEHQGKRLPSVVTALLAALIAALSVIAMGILFMLLWPS
jgi:hypothetical protein